MAETQIEKHIRLLGITKEEAEELEKSDKEIDKMSSKELTADMTEEQKRNAKKYTSTTSDKKKTVYKFATDKKRKENPIKSSIISEIAQFLTEKSKNSCENVNITNAERQIAFKIGENDYEITLVQKRKSKK